MKKNYQSIVKLSGIVFLLTLFFTPVVSAQPAMQYLNVLGSAFNPTSSTQNYSTGEGCIWDTGGVGQFTFPVLLPRGSVITRLDYYFFETVPGAPLFLPSLLILRKFNPLPSPPTTTGLIGIPLVAVVGKAVFPSGGFSIPVETDCTVDSQCFYELFWQSRAANTSRLCGARIHYIPPFGALALPLIQRN
jgi:hypothetical protein